MEYAFERTKLESLDMTRVRLRRFSLLTALTAAILPLLPSKAQQPITFDDLIPAHVGWQSGCYTVDDDSSCSFTLSIFGRIGVDTMAKVQRALMHRSSNERLVVSLNSPGGDIEAAMSLGRVIREARGHTQVEPPASCASACVLVFAGGIVRGTFGKSNVGIHRPALSAVPQEIDMNAVKATTDDAVHKLKVYAAEMNVSERLIDDMLVIPPEKIRWLSNDDLNAYGLGFVDPIYAETVILDGAKRYGITPAEYRARDERAKSECQSLTDDEVFGYLDGERSPCAQAILSGKR